MDPRAAKWVLSEPFHDSLEVTMATEGPGLPETDGPFDRLEAKVLAYQIFGSDIGSPVVVRTPVEVGDTIGLVYRFLGPLRMFFASRVVDVFVREPSEGGVRSGFVYRTLRGHPEVGEEIFEVRKSASGVVTFRIEAWSRPNLWYVKIFTKWARWIQKRAAQSAARALRESLVH